MRMLYLKIIFLFLLLIILFSCATTIPPLTKEINNLPYPIYLKAPEFDKNVTKQNLGLGMILRFSGEYRKATLIAQRDYNHFIEKEYLYEQYQTSVTKGNFLNLIPRNLNSDECLELQSLLIGYFREGYIGRSVAFRETGYKESYKFFMANIFKRSM